MTTSSTRNMTKVLRAVRQSDLIITPALTRFLLKTPNFDLDEDIADLIRDLLVKKQRDRSGSFSSSAAGKCGRMQLFQYVGVDPGGMIDPQLQNIFYDGTWRHLRWQAMLLQAGILTKVETMLDWPAMRSMGSMDGEGVVPDDHPRERWRGLEYGFELKGLNSWGFKALNGMKEAHLDQVHRYFLSGGHPLFVIIYENKDNQQWHEWVIEPDPDRLRKQQDELNTLNDAVDHKRLLPMLPECRERKGEDWRNCAYAGRGGICERQGSTWPE